ncbi:hypothetical protein CGZ93_17500 [Enemella dayhoffiae]|uniref:MaoC-like domain-containing protein n=1 Tax=Enemella dayhoffiae TaxID=2016507 RepID=A0A255GLX1_9ACTN|nr:MaoC/PaaZ C-terminal domain-containing protein [Enemella dayhoffiae]OYO16561.1 hypothetical protein CGZ93_17500 [Enemella dayhoffiae]
MMQIPEPRRIGPVTVTDFVRYQGASGDMNPIHHDTEFARRAGFDSPFAVGMWPAGLLASYATDWLGPENIRSFRIRFAEQIWPGDELELTAELGESSAEDGTELVEVALTCTRIGGGVAVRAWARFATEEVSA